MALTTTPRQRRTGITALVLAVASVALMAADTQFAWTRHLRAALLSALYPVQRVVGAPVELGQAVTREVRQHLRVYQQNERLRSEIRRLRIQSQRLAALREENNRLRQLLNEAERLERSVSAAQVVAESPDPFHHVLTISRGREHGAYEEQPVISADGLVGQISSLAPYSAQVILLTDPNSGIPVLVRGSRVRGILAGTGNKDRLELRYVPTSADVAPGDTLVTSGLGSVYPKGLVAARVTKVVQDPRSTFSEIQARPAAPVSRLEDVLLLHEGTRGRRSSRSQAP
jgi:rod shape-determining protein MreC